MDEKKYDTPLTEGCVWKQITRFFFPIFLGAFFQQLYNMTDAVILGQFAGTDAFGAVSALGNLFRLPLNFFGGLAAGASVVLSQLYGAKNGPGLRRAVGATAFLTLVCGAAFSALGVAFSPVCLLAINMPAALYPHALVYTRIYFGGLFFSLIYNMGAGALRAVGDSRRPFYFLIVSCCLNIGLDLDFVALLHMGAAGAALATVLSQAVSALLVVRALLRTDGDYRLLPSMISGKSAFLKDILKTGVPIGVQGILWPIANLMIQSAVNLHGADAVAAWGVSGKLDFIIWIVLDEMGITASTFTAQNFGAQKYSRAREGVRVCILLSLLMVIPMSLTLYFFSDPLGFLFVDNAAVVALSAQLMRTYLAPYYFAYIGGEVLCGTIRGTGETFRPMLLTLLCICAFRIVWTLVAQRAAGTLDAVVLCYPCSWFLNSGAFLLYYFTSRSPTVHLLRRGAEQTVPALQRD